MNLLFVKKKKKKNRDKHKLLSFIDFKVSILNQSQNQLLEIAVF